MNCIFNINVCRICMQNEQSCDLLSDNILLEKFEFSTRLRITKEDNLPKSICSKCVIRLKVAYTFIKTAHESEKNLKTFLDKISSEFKEVTQINKSNNKFLSDEKFTDEDLLSLMDEESNEGSKYRSEFEPKTLGDDGDIKQSKDVEKCKNGTDYVYSKDILLIHSTNEIDSDCENNSHFMEIPLQDDDGKEHYEEDHESEHIGEYTTSNINMLDSNEESEIRSQSSVLAVAESEDNNEYDTVISSQDDTIQCQNIYIDENSVDGTNRNDQDDFQVNDLNGEKEMTANSLEKSQANERNEIISKSYIRKEGIVHRFYCDKCSRDFSTKTNLNRHMQSHEGNKPFSCTECKKSFTQKSTLKQHMYTHTGERPYVCDVCYRGFTQCKSLIFHMRRHTGEKPFHCEYCLITFRQKDALRIHIIKHHVIIERAIDGTEIFSCIICQRKFETNSEFKTHMKVHTATGEIDVFELFPNEEEKLSSKIKKSSDVTAYADSELLNAAVVNVSASSASEPSRAKKYQCRKCFKCFALKKSLARHVRIHNSENGDNLTECFECDLQFSSTEIYQEHVSECHQYACSACPEAVFTTIQELKMHMFDHELNQHEQ